MESKHFLLAVCTLFLLSSFVQGQPGRHYVTCAHQQEKCVCKSSATECFDGEKLQTFTSYTLGTQGEIVTRGTLEDTYYWEGNELTPLINCPTANVPEYGNCSWISF